MTGDTTQLLRFSQRFGKYYTRQFAPLLAETDLSMREVHVLLFLINNPRCDTARDVADLRGLANPRSRRRWSCCLPAACSSGRRMRRTGG